MSLTLTPDELRDLTGRKRSDAQQVQLRAMGIPFYVRADGRLAVLRVSVEGRATIQAREPALRP
jgi:hypothetical protein